MKHRYCYVLQEAAVSAVAESGVSATESTPSKPVTSGTETEAATEKVANAEEVMSTPTKTTTQEESKQEASSPASPSETATPEEGGSEKKKKSKKKWSFRSFSFSKKDKQKPASKEEKQETVLEVCFNLYLLTVIIAFF